MQGTPKYDEPIWTSTDGREMIRFLKCGYVYTKDGVLAPDSMLGKTINAAKKVLLERNREDIIKDLPD